MGASPSPSRPPVVLAFNNGALALARGLGRAGLRVIGLGFYPLYPHGAFESRYFSERIVAPARSGAGEMNMLNVLERIAVGRRPVIFPSDDDSVAWIAGNWEAVRELADVALPDDMEVVRRLTRKDLVEQEAERASIPYPRTARPRSAAEVRSCGLTPPLLVKPVEGKSFVHRFGEKVFVAATIDEALAGWNRARTEGIDTIVQELVPGHEGNVYSFFGYLDRRQRPLATVVGRKVRESPRPFGSSTVFAAEWNERVYELVVALLRTSGYWGFVHVELAYDERIDDFVLIEVNTRVPTWAGIAMTHSFNIARVAYLDLSGHDQECRQLRRPWLWVNLIDDVSAGAPPLREVPRFVAPYLRRRTVGALFAWDDPRPGLAGGARFLRSSVRLRSRLKATARRLMAGARDGA